MSLSSAPAKTGGIPTAIAIVTAPKSAFQALRAVPTWGWAFLIATVLAIVGSFLTQAATMHLIAASMAKTLAASPSIANMTPEKQQAAIAQATSFGQVAAKFGWIAAPIAVLLIGLLQSVGMLVIAKIAKSTVGFKSFWASAINISIVSYGIGSIVIGLIATLRGAESFSSQRDLLAAMPSAALLLGNAPVKLVALIGALTNPIAIWSTVLTFFALLIVGNVPKRTAQIGAIALLVIGSAVGAAFAS